MITLLLADDNQIMRQGLRAILEAGDGLHVVAEAWDGHSAVEAARRFTPDVALVDIRMPGMDGLEATRALRELPAPPRVLVLTMVGGDEYVDTAIRAGAHGFLLKDTPPDDLLAGIRKIAHGEAVLDSAVTAGVFQRLTAHAPHATTSEDTAVAGLGERELTVLRLVCQGHSNAEIAARLNFSEATVKGQLSRLMAKLSVGNRVQLARIGYHAGLDT